MIKNKLLAALMAGALITSPASQFYKTPTGFKLTDPSGINTTMSAISRVDQDNILGTAPSLLSMMGIPLGIGGGSISTVQIIQSIQFGQVSITTATTTGTATISAVTVANTALIWGGITISQDGAQIQNATGRITLTNTTTVTLTRTGSSASCQMFVDFIAVEFKSSALQSSVQYGSAAIATGTATISSVNTSYAVAFYNGYQRGGTGSGTNSQFGACQLTGATTVTVYSNVSDNSATTYFCVVEFKSSILAQAVQTFNVSLTSVNSNTTTITSADTSRSMLCYGGMTTAATSDTPGHVTRMAQTSATVITANRGSSDSNNSTIYGTIIVFATGIVKSKQTGSISIGTGSASATATITAVTVAQTIVTFNGNSSADSTNDKRKQLAMITLTSTTVITASTNVAPAVNSAVVPYEAVEFN